MRAALLVDALAVVPRASMPTTAAVPGCGSQFSDRFEAAYDALLSLSQVEWLEAVAARGVRIGANPPVGEGLSVEGNRISSIVLRDAWRANC